MRYLPKMQQLRVFQEVVRQGSIRSAARALAQSQPAISRTLKELENVLQTSLFKRGPAGITLTPGGELFAVRARLILAELQKAGEEIHSLQQQQGQLSVAMSALPGLLLLPTVLEKFRLTFPSVNLTVTDGTLRDLLPALAAGEIDFAIVQLPAQFADERITIEPLFNVPLCVAAGQTHPQRHCENLLQLANEKWLILEGEVGSYGGLSQELEVFFQQFSGPLIHTNSLLYGMQLARTSGYLMVMPRILLSEFSHTLLALNLPLQSVWHYSIVCSRHSPLTHQARQLLELVLDICHNAGENRHETKRNQRDKSIPAQWSFPPLSRQ